MDSIYWSRFSHLAKQYRARQNQLTNGRFDQLSDTGSRAAWFCIALLQKGEKNNFPPPVQLSGCSRFNRFTFEWTVKKKERRFLSFVLFFKWPTSWNDALVLQGWVPYADKNNRNHHQKAAGVVSIQERVLVLSKYSKVNIYVRIISYHIVS